MEQRANRARNAVLAGQAAESHSGWSGAWNSESLPPLPYDGRDTAARGARASDGRTPRAPALDEDGYADAARAPKRPTTEDSGPSKRVRDAEVPRALDAVLGRRDAYVDETLADIRELHPQFVGDTGADEEHLALDDQLSFSLPQHYDAETRTGLADAAAVAAAMHADADHSEPVPRRLLPRGENAQRKVKPGQEKARAAFVAAHAGQTYEQMVLERAYSSDRLFWLKEAYGLTWRTGRWSQEEEDLATAALDKFCKHYKLSSAALDELIWHRKPEQKHMHEELWKHIALSVGTRPNYAVRMHIKSMRKNVVRGGNWTPAEVDALAAAVAELGHQWEKIGERLGRSGNVCKHYWREQMQGSPAAHAPQGAFRPEEEAALRQAVLACCEKVGCDPDGPNLPWTLIHEQLGPSTRRISVLSRKWRGMLSAERRNSEDQNTRWYAPHDDHVLLRRVRAQRKGNAADIEFDKLASDDWQWPTYVVKKHWTGMLRKRVPPQFSGDLDALLDLLESRVPSPDEYKMLASGRRPSKSSEAAYAAGGPQ
ncbi:hypothetical protein MBRA1_001587 [Malassezia brasiliensis]|uniref:DNA-binding protein REB1 n=1 Tax=Malassezia brasiliensis TaxID=1821822 RepID=A0AAF0INC4_9BASI|nr:hypothetical protein MBRA1_001587 [Malassezia brasiliensis]